MEEKRRRARELKELEEKAFWEAYRKERLKLARKRAREKARKEAKGGGFLGGLTLQMPDLWGGLWENQSAKPKKGHSKRKKRKRRKKKRRK